MSQELQDKALEIGIEHFMRWIDIDWRIDGCRFFNKSLTYRLRSYYKELEQSDKINEIILDIIPEEGNLILKDSEMSYILAPSLILGINKDYYFIGYQYQGIKKLIIEPVYYRDEKIHFPIAAVYQQRKIVQ